MQRMIVSTQSYLLLAIPFFVLIGYLMNAADASRRLVNFATSFFGNIGGSIGYVNIAVSTMMSGMSGSSNADAAMMSKMMVNPMLERGFSRGMIAAITASSALIAPPYSTKYCTYYVWLCG